MYGFNFKKVTSITFRHHDFASLENLGKKIAAGNELNDLTALKERACNYPHFDKKGQKQDMF